MDSDLSLYILLGSCDKKGLLFLICGVYSNWGYLSFCTFITVQVGRVAVGKRPSGSSPTGHYQALLVLEKANVPISFFFFDENVPISLLSLSL